MKISTIIQIFTLFRSLNACAATWCHFQCLTDVITADVAGESSAALAQTTAPKYKNLAQNKKKSDINSNFLNRLMVTESCKCEFAMIVFSK